MAQEKLHTYVTFCFFLANIGLAAPTSDPCSTYVNITDYRRSTSYLQPSSASKWICDVSLSSSTWYRFASLVGGNIPTHCVEPYTCGTHDPIWINGSHPSEADGTVSRKVCASEDEPNCCGWSDTIQIKNCGDFYVYNLAVPTECYYAYCAGNASICGSESSDSSDCVEPYPSMSGDPKLEGPLINHENGEFYFKCTVQFTESNTDVKFEVQWLFDYKSDPTLTSTILDEDDLSITLSSHNMTYDDNRLGKILLSETSPLILEENAGPEPVTVECTVPVLCKTSNACHLKLYSANEDDVALISAEDCSVVINPEDWDESTRSSKKIYNVVALRDNVLDGTRIIRIGFEPLEEPTNDNLFIWNNYVVETIPVRTIDKDAKQCRSYGFTHYRTFDGLRFDYAGVGEFVLMKSNTRNFEVQNRVTECGKHGRTACNCGVAVRENNDVIIIDYCAALKTADITPTDMAPKVNIRSQDLSSGTTLRMNSQGNTFLVYFYSGAWIKVHLYIWGIDIVVHAPSDDYGETGGLCGLFDGDPSNDFKKADESSIPVSSEPKNFADSWRVGQGNSLFINEIDNVRDVENIKSCRCHGDDRSENVCGYRARVTNQDILGNDVTDLFLATNSSDVESVGLDLITDDFSFSWNLNFQADIPDWPTPSGVTEQKATEQCTDVLEGTQFADGCESNTYIKRDDIIDDCVFDIQISGDSDVAISSLNTYQDICSETAVRDLSVTNPSTITSNICVNGCSSHGTCVNMRCTCNSGYVGEDCSVAENTKPTVHGLRWDGACDVATRPCEYVFVIGEGFLNTEYLTCRITFEEAVVIGVVVSLVIVAVAAMVAVVVWNKKREKQTANGSVEPTTNQQYGHFKNDTSSSSSVKMEINTT
ncbi:von Willebrand factor D and EGF domain-containing protein-like [Glandiceps talaboti]